MENKLINNLPSDLRLIYERIVSRFLERVADDDKNRLDKNYYWKWVATSHLANDFNISPAQMRSKLNKLEKIGLICSKREPNYVLWASLLVDGFTQFLYDDYFIRDCSIKIGDVVKTKEDCFSDIEYDKSGAKNIGKETYTVTKTEYWPQGEGYLVYGDKSDKRDCVVWNQETDLVVISKKSNNGTDQTV